jgi:hypothetical protein
VLAQEPDNTARLLTGIKQLLLNMQFLMNCLRPAQVSEQRVCLARSHQDWFGLAWPGLVGAGWLHGSGRRSPEQGAVPPACLVPPTSRAEANRAHRAAALPPAAIAQARQMLKQLLQQQLAEKREALQELRQARGGVDQLLLQAALELELAAGDSAQSAEQPLAMEL